MAEGDGGWKISKDDPQPSRGRAVRAPPPALRHQDRSIQHQQRAFELELRTYSGDDPLDVWDRYLKWTLQAYPQGGKESNLTVILERAVHSFVDDKRYYNDARYVNIWIKLAQNSTEPDDIYSYMQTQGLGVSQAALYTAWAEEHERSGGFQRAYAILKDGLKCGAQPSDTLQQYYKGFQARAFRQTVAGGPDGTRGEEEEGTSPPKICRVDLRPRGRSKVKKQQTPQTPREPSSVAPPPFQPPFQPFIDDSEQTPSTSACETDRAASTVPSERRRPEEEPALDSLQNQHMQEEGGANTQNQHMQGHMQEEGGANTQSMYCRELVMGQVEEFSFEELRAERYFKHKRRELDEKNKHLSQVEDELRQRIEQKKRLLLLRESQRPRQPQMGPDVPMDETRDQVSARPSGSDPGSDPGSGPGSDPGSGPGAGALIGQRPSVPFQIYDESGSDSRRNSNTENIQNTSDDVFLQPGERALGFKIQHPVPYAKKITLPERAQVSKNVPERTEYLSEEPIVYGHNNKTLCATPNDTSDFAQATKMVSTPYTSTRGQRMNLPSISPIKEASNEDYSSLSSASASLSSAGVQSGGKSTGHLSRLEESHAHQETADQTAPSVQSPVEEASVSPVEEASVSPVEQPSVGSGRDLLSQLDLGALPNFHSEDGPLPTVEEGDVLVLGDMTVFIYKVEDYEDFSICSGRNEGHFVLKVDRRTVPWDFYVSSQLRQRLARDPQALTYDPGHCFLFQDGCITVYSQPASQQGSLRRVWERRSDERGVAALAVGLVELVRNMHACSLVHGALSPDTLFLRKSVCDSPGEEVDIVAMDLTCSVDLELQKDVTSVQHLAVSQRYQNYITQGLLVPSASPYQVDLMGVAETVHALLTSRTMSPVRDGSEWTLEEYREANPSGRTRKVFWSKFFRTILNPGEKSSQSVLSELLKDMKMADFGIQPCCRAV